MQDAKMTGVSRELRRPDRGGPMKLLWRIGREVTILPAGTGGHGDGADQRCPIRCLEQATGSEKPQDTAGGHSVLSCANLMVGYRRDKTNHVVYYERGKSSSMHEYLLARPTMTLVEKGRRCASVG